jgi:type IV pilus assembly protein PilF
MFFFGYLVFLQDEEKDMKSKVICVGKAAVISKLAMVLCMVLLVGCVTTTNSRYGNHAKASEALEKYTDLGLVYLQKGDTHEAMRPLRRALELGPQSPDVHAAFAMLFELEKDFLRAENYFNNALSYSSGVNKTRIRNNYASFLFKTERLMDACEQLRLASEDPFYERRATVYENLGVCYQRLGLNDNALEAYERAINIDDTRGRAFLEAAYLQFGNDNLDVSGEYHVNFQRLVRDRTASSSPKSLWLGVKLARYRGDQNAEASYELKLRNQFPDSPENKSLLKGR